jgi:hypothetical protein
MSSTGTFIAGIAILLICVLLQLANTLLLILYIRRTQKKEDTLPDADPDKLTSLTPPPSPPLSKVWMGSPAHLQCQMRDYNGFFQGPQYALPPSSNIREVLRHQGHAQRQVDAQQSFYTERNFDSYPLPIVTRESQVVIESAGGVF